MEIGRKISPFCGPRFSRLAAAHSGCSHSLCSALRAQRIRRKKGNAFCVEIVTFYLMFSFARKPRTFLLRLFDCFIEKGGLLG